MTEQQYDRKDLKIHALKERISQIVADYEDKDADRRVEITELVQRVQLLQQELEEANAPTQEEHEIPSE